MSKKLLFICGIICYVAGAIYIALTIGLFDLPDAFFFYNLGNLILYKIYYSIFPFNQYLPNTTNAPLYGMFLRFMTSNAYWAMTAISFTQLLMVGMSAWCIYRSANFVKKGLGKFAVIYFFLMPFLFVYAVSMSSEIFAIFLVSLYLYITLGIVTKHLRASPSVLIFLACILAITKFIFFYIIPINIVFAVYAEFKKGKVKRGGLFVVEQILAIVGIVCVFFWMQFIHGYYGRWAMTVTSGRELYTGIVQKSGVLPSPDSQAYKVYRMWTGFPTVKRTTTEIAEGYFIPAFQQNKLTEVQIDDIFRNFALAALRQHFLYIFLDAFRGGYRIFISPPYHTCLLANLGAPEAACTTKHDTSCRVSWFCQVKGCTDAEQGSMCQPLQKNPMMIALWAVLIHFYEGYYPYVMIGLCIFMIIGAVMSIVHRSVPLIVVTFYGGLLLGFQGIFSAVEGRYTMITYPFIAILIAYGIHTITEFLVRKLSP